ncbi:DUF6777 domain-containing protein [Streptomyces coeruleorubidus]
MRRPHREPTREEELASVEPPSSGRPTGPPPGPLSGPSQPPSGGGPPSEPPSGGGQAPEPRRPWWGSVPRVALIATAVVAAVILAVVFTRPDPGGTGASDGGTSTSEGEVFLQPAAGTGPDPFTESTAKESSASPVSPSPPDVPAYLRSLTPVVLSMDTRVTNHGHSDGRATGYQAVLQSGTAVLVDDRGVPRVRCACGNPLAAPVAQQSAPKMTGDAWPGYKPSNVVAVTPAPEPVDVFVMCEPDGEWFERHKGDTGTKDRKTEKPDKPSPSVSVTTPTSPSDPTSSEPPTSEPPTSDPGTSSEPPASEPPTSEPPQPPPGNDTGNGTGSDTGNGTTDQPPGS